MKTASEIVVAVPAIELVEDFGLYPRLAVDDLHVRALADALLAGATLPPVVAERKTKRLVDGFHRRRAALKVHGAQAEIGVIWRDYAGDGEMLLDAARLNAGHGRRLTLGEQVRVAHLADELGLSRDAVAKALAVRLDVLAARIERRTAFDPVRRPLPVKPALQHLAGGTLTADQVAANKHLGGHQARYLARQLLLLVRARALNWGDSKLVAMLVELSRELNEAIAESQVS